MKRHLPLIAALTCVLAAVVFAAPRLLNGGPIPPPAAAELAGRPVSVVPPSKPAAAVPGHSHHGSYTLTFDDGPHPVHTPALLDWLKEHQIKATFFVLGQNAKRYPELVKRIAAEGHEIGNHTWSHVKLTTAKPEVLRSEIKRTHDLIVSLTGKPPVSFRPPYGALTIAQRRVVEKEFGYHIVRWTADSFDWKPRSSDAVVKRLRLSVKPGAIILAHDIHPRILPALETLYAEWTRRGLKAVPLSNMSPPPVKETTLLTKAAAVK